MRTGRSLTVCCSLLPGGRGVPGPGGSGVPGLGGLLPGGSAPGGSAPRGSGGYPSMHWGRHPSPLWTNTRLWKYYLGPTSLRLVTRKHSGRMSTTRSLSYGGSLPRQRTPLPDRDPSLGQRHPPDRDPNHPVNIITDKCKNITFPQLRLQEVMKYRLLILEPYNFKNQNCF